MKKHISIILILFALLFIFTSCGNSTPDTDTEADSQIIDTDTDINETKIEKITDFPDLAELNLTADKINVTINANSKYEQYLITDKASVLEIMECIYNVTFVNVGKEIPLGAQTYRLDIYDGEKSFVVTESMLFDGDYYEIRGDVELTLNRILNPFNEYMENGNQNSVNPTLIDVKKYYEKLQFGDYIGENIPSYGNEGHDFEFGYYYEIIGDYDVALNSFSNTKDLKESFFDDYYIFVIGMHIESGLPYDIYGFYDLYFDWESKVAKISFDGLDGLDVTQACAVYNFYLKVPKNKYSVGYWHNKKTGKLDWEFNKEDDYLDRYSSYKSEKLLNIKENTSWFLGSTEEINKFGRYYGIKELTSWKREDSYLLVIYMKTPCSNCFRGFKDLHTDGKTIYITAEETDYNHSHINNERAFVVIEVFKNETLYPLKSMTRLVVLYELNKREFIK